MAVDNITYSILEQLVLGRNYNAVYVNVVAYVSWSCGKSAPPSASVFNNSCVLRNLGSEVRCSEVSLTCREVSSAVLCWVVL